MLWQQAAISGVIAATALVLAWADKGQEQVDNASSRSGIGSINTFVFVAVVIVLVAK